MKETDIEIVKRIDRTLKKCLIIHIENLQLTEALKTFVDIIYCKKELYKLIAAKKVLGAVKEPEKCNKEQKRKKFFLKI